MSEIAIGVIGCGEWGPNHIRNFNELEGCRVRIAADLSRERLGAISRRFPTVATTTDASEVIRADVDAVAIATPTSTHHALAKQALEAGKHVLCEKPLALGSHEAEELVELADRRGRILMVGHVFMFNPGVLQLKRQIDEGELGTVYYMDAVRTNLGPIRTDVGAIYDLASHDISIFNFLLEAEPLEVSAVGGHYIQREREDMAFITLEYPRSTLCHVHVSWLNPRKVRQITIVGDKKMALWDDMQPLEPIRIYDKGLQEKPFYDTFGQFQMSLRDAEIRIPKVRMFEPLARQAQSFVESIRLGVPPVSDGRNGLAVVRALEAATESLRHQGRPCAVPRSGSRT